MHRRQLTILLAGLLVSGVAARGEGIKPYSVSVHINGEKVDTLRRLFGVSPDPIFPLLLDLSTAFAERHSPPPTFTLLEAIARDDARKMKQALRAEGYYDASVKVEIADRDHSPRLYFKVTTGPLFQISSVRIENTGSPLPNDVVLPAGGEIGLPPGEPGSAGHIFSAQAALLRRLLDQGFPAARVADREVVVDHSDRTVSVTFRVDPGARAAFGQTVFDGLQDVREKLLRKQIPWKPGAVYRPRRVQEFRDRLARLGLFSTLLISTEEGEAPAAGEGEGPPLRPINILVSLRERDSHTFGLEAGYGTDIGVGGAVSWEDRNLTGHGDLFRLRIFGSEDLYYAEGVYRVRSFLHPDQSLTLSVQPVYDQPRAYTSYRWRGAALLRREFSDHFALSGGTAYTYDRVEQFDQEQEFFLCSLPLSAQFQAGRRVEQRLERAGVLLMVQGEPYYDLKRENYFVKTLASASFLYRFPGADFLSAVARATAGSLPAADLAEVPADLRFYAGGANSIRGYAYQKVGPMVDGSPVGGLSIFTTSFELNCRVIGDFGAAAFVDGGAAFAEDFPRFGDEIRWGTGVGLRYFSLIGPVGLDLGFPIDPRPGIDAAFQVYVSVAQIY